MSSNIITYFLLYQVFSHLLVLLLYETSALENIAGEISFRSKHKILFPNFIGKWKDRQFTIKTFHILNLPLLCYLLRVEGKLINASTWCLWSWKTSTNEKDFWLILLKIEMATILRSMDTEASNFQVRLRFYGTFQK